MIDLQDKSVCPTLAEIGAYVRNPVFMELCFQSESAEESRIMKKTAFIIFTGFIMLAASGFAVRIIDAAVQIDDDIFLLLAFLAAMNLGIGFVSYKIYKLSNKK